MSPAQRSTQEACLRAVRPLAEHYHKAPDLITEQQIRQYFLHLINLKHYSRNTTIIALCGIRFFFEQTLNRHWTLFNIVPPAPASIFGLRKGVRPSDAMETRHPAEK